MFINILDSKRKRLLPYLENLKQRFYLAGGTGLALQLGHRDSVDFDFFSQKNFDTRELFAFLKEILAPYKIKKIQEEKNTLTVLLDNTVKLSFFAYPYKLIDKIINEKYLRIASQSDIGCMKLSAIINRATTKDYVDLYYILQKIDLSDLLIKVQKKMPEIDTGLILKSLIFFDDIPNEPLLFKVASPPSFEKIKKSLQKKVKEYFDSTVDGHGISKPQIH